MKRRSVFLLSVLCAIGVLIGAANAYAFGFGPYFEYAVGSASYDDHDEYLDKDSDIDVTGLGIVMDTNLSRPRLFNYRLNLGYNWLDGEGRDGWRVSLENTFGFGIIKKEKFRFWLGPQLHLSGGEMDITPIISSDFLAKLYADYSSGPGGNPESVTDNYSFNGFATESASFYGLGLGFVTGANFQLPRVGSVCVELGARYQYNAVEYIDIYSIETDKVYYENGQTGERTIMDLWGDASYDYEETVIFMKVAFMFGR